MADYTSSYQAAFDKVASLLADSSPYTRSSIEAYFQATMLMNIGSDYSALVSSIQKEWKTGETTNLSETILQIVRHSEFMKSSAKNNVLRVTTAMTTPTGTQQTPTLAGGALKGSCNALGKMKTRGSQKDLRSPQAQELPGETPELDS